MSFVGVFEAEAEAGSGLASRLAGFAAAAGGLFELGGLGSASDKARFVEQVAARLRAVAAEEGEGDLELARVLLDCLRICFREKVSIDAATTVDSLQVYLALLGRAVRAQAWPLADMALRCLTNCTYKDPPAAARFLSAPVRGPEAVLRLCLSPLSSTAAAAAAALPTAQLALRLLFMLAASEAGGAGSGDASSQPPSVRATLLAPTPLATVVAALATAAAAAEAAPTAAAAAAGSVFAEACKLLHLLGALPLLLSHAQTGPGPGAAGETSVKEGEGVGEGEGEGESGWDAVGGSARAAAMAAALEAALVGVVARELERAGACSGSGSGSDAGSGSGAGAGAGAEADEGAGGSLDRGGDACPLTAFALQVLMTRGEGQGQGQGQGEEQDDGEADDGKADDASASVGRKLAACGPGLLALLHGALIRCCCAGAGAGAGAGMGMEEQAFVLLPLLAVCARAVRLAGPAGSPPRRALHALVFAPASGPGGKTTGAAADGLAPADRGPPRSLRRLLLGLMTSLEGSGGLARLSAELVWALSSGDKDEFVRCAGMGNAVGLLRLRGLV